MDRDDKRDGEDGGRRYARKQMETFFFFFGYINERRLGLLKSKRAERFIVPISYN